MTSRDDISASLSDLSVEVRQNLSCVDRSVWEGIEKACLIQLDFAINDGFSDLADLGWFFAKFSRQRYEYLRCFELMKNGEFYKAWCLLEQIEIALSLLKKNEIFVIETEVISKFSLLISSWQELFPYRYFLSPGMQVKGYKCSICNSQINPWSNCNHRVGRVYAGRECYRIAEGIELLEISIVSNPVQKYSVLFLGDDQGSSKDHYDYSLVKFVLERLSSPFDGWRAHWTKAYHPHSLFSDHSIDWGCPCSSGRRYQDCCLHRKGVVRPHLEVIFDVLPSCSLPTAVLAGYGGRIQDV